MTRCAPVFQLQGIISLQISHLYGGMRVCVLCLLIFRQNCTIFYGTFIMEYLVRDPYTICIGLRATIYDRHRDAAAAAGSENIDSS